jgi:hypothetical protein
MAQIKVIADINTGEIKIEAMGFTGQTCAEATEFLKNLGDVSEWQAKAEWFETNLELTGCLNTNHCG